VTNFIGCLSDEALKDLTITLQISTKRFNLQTNLLKVEEVPDELRFKNELDIIQKQIFDLSNFVAGVFSESVSKSEEYTKLNRIHQNLQSRKDTIFNSKTISSDLVKKHFLQQITGFQQQLSSLFIKVGMAS
jgi:hypothetical protein